MNRKINILLFSPLPHGKAFGGIGSWTLRFQEEFANSDKIIFDIVDSSSIDKKGRDLARSKNVVKKIFLNLNLLKIYKKKINVSNLDIVHINTSCTPFACIRDFFLLKYAKRNKIKTILHLRCNVKDQLHGSRIGIYFLKRNLRLTSFVFTLNNTSTEFIHHLYSKCLCEKISNFIDQNSIINNKTINKKVRKIVFAGHLVKEKGIDEIVEVARSNPNLKFFLVSEFTEQYSKTYVFPPNVIICGAISNKKVLEKLDECDIFLFPTHTEGFSNSLLEAMARGMPIITTNVGANFEMIEDKGGLIVDINNVEAINKSFNILSDVNIRKKMSKWNIAKVKSQYSSNVVVDKILNKYLKLMGITK